VNYGTLAVGGPWTLSGSKILPKLWPIGPSPGAKSLPSTQAVASSDALGVEVWAPRSAWIEAARVRLQELANLQPGWDGSRAPALAVTCLNDVARFVESSLIADLPVKPQIVPTAHGGLLLEWHTEEVDFIVESSPVEPPTFYYREARTDFEDEGLVCESSPAILRAFDRLGRA